MLLLLTIRCVFFQNNCLHYDWFSFSHLSFIFLKMFSIHVRDVCVMSCHFVSNLSLRVFVSRRMRMMLIAIFPFPLSMRRHQPDGKDQLLQILTLTSWKREIRLEDAVEMKTRVKLVLISRRPTCDIVAGCNWQRSVICSNGPPAHLRWTVDVLKFARIQIELQQFQPFHL